MMIYEKVLKFLKIIGSIFILISLVELVFIILMNFVYFNIDGSSYLLFEIVFSSTMFPFSGTLLWIFLISSMICYALIGFFFYQTGSKTEIESIPLAKFLVVAGMIVLLAGFVKLDFLVNLGKTRITSTITTVSFQTALYDMHITPIMPGIFWVFFMSANIALLISGLAITAVGIKYTLLQEQEVNK